MASDRQRREKDVTKQREMLQNGKMKKRTEVLKSHWCEKVEIIGKNFTLQLNRGQWLFKKFLL